MATADAITLGTVSRTLSVPVPPEQAFAAFAERMGTWWPRENTLGRDAFETVVIEPAAGGRWLERTSHGGESEWGRVLAWDPPRRIVLTWQMTPQGLPEPDPGKASEVEVRFVPEGTAATRVELEHRAFERHGDDGAAVWQAGMASPEGWTKILRRYALALD
jgi:uncharacterized protein YndB with AHSA1/START domain